MFFLLVSLLFSIKVTAMGSLKPQVIQKTHRGKVILMANEQRQKDFYRTEKALIEVIGKRLQTFEDIQDEEEFKKHHLSLMICAFHNGQEELFTRLWQFPNLDTTIFAWQEIKIKNEQGELLPKQEGTLEEYLKLFCYDEHGEADPQLIGYLHHIKAPKGSE